MRVVLGLAVVAGLAIAVLSRHSVLINPEWQGTTMGTVYTIRVCGTFPKSEMMATRERIDEALVEINRQMSTWDPQSEISRFNHSTSTNPFAVSPDFADVVRRALEFSRTTDGAFDPTLQPLLNLWGFGSEGYTTTVPSAEAIATARAMTGWKKISVPGPAQILKSDPRVSLDLGAIAKGYGVDCVGRILDEAGHENWFVEIGGEVVLRGNNPSGAPWKIGIQYPSFEPADGKYQGILHITEGAVATSGNYRNFIEQDGAIYSHILDPRSGSAVLSDTASVSVYAPNCTDADGLATALYVMGPEEGLAWVEQRPGIEALFLIRAGDDAIIEKFSSGFVEATGYISGGGVENRP